MYDRDDFYTEMEAEEQFLGSIWDWATGSTGSTNGRVDRKSKPYAKWVQRSLNKVAGLRLAIDGDIGTMTKSAIRDFQRKHGLKVDGIVGANTERALITAGADKPPVSPRGPSTPAPSGTTGPLALVNTRMPKSGLGFLTSKNNYKYGVPETIEALKAIAREWHRRHPDVRFMVRDVSRQGGGKFSTHKSHRIGLDADVQLWVGNQMISSTHPDYAKWRPYIEDLALIIRSNPSLPVKKVWFQDKKRRTKNVNHIGSGHTRHLHIRFCMPVKYVSLLNLNLVYKAGEKKADYRC